MAGAQELVLLWLFRVGGSGWKHCKSTTEIPALLVTLSQGNLQAKEWQQLEELHMPELHVCRQLSTKAGPAIHTGLVGWWTDGLLLLSFVCLWNWICILGPFTQWNFRVRCFEWTPGSPRESKGARFLAIKMVGTRNKIWILKVLGPPP